MSTGKVTGGELQPSVDLPHHLYLYRHMSDVGGIIHTHSNYATAFAACRMSIPLCLTAIADEFGCEIPCAPYVDNIADHIGKVIVKGQGRAPAVLLANHGVFTWGKTVRDAFKAAVMIEDVAKTVHLASQMGHPETLSSEEAEKWYVRYHSRYGQNMSGNDSLY